METENAIMWYYIGHYSRFKDLPDATCKVLSKELSDLSQAIPLHHFIREYKKGEMERAMKILDPQLLSADEDNYVYVRNSMENKFTPLQCVALMAYLLNRLSGWQLGDKPDYAWVKNAHLIIENEKPTDRKPKSPRSNKKRK